MRATGPSAVPVAFGGTAWPPEAPFLLRVVVGGLLRADTVDAPTVERIGWAIVRRPDEP